MGRAHHIVLTEPPDRVSAFFRREPGLLDDKSEHGMTPLMVCLESCRPETGLVLIELGADVNRADRYGRTALMFAAENGLGEIALVLLKQGADVNATDTADGFSATDWAILRKHDGVAAILRQAGGLAKQLEDR